MEPTGTKRKIAVIVMADVVGYSRLMGQDEEETVRRLKAHQRVFSGHISKSRGRIVNAPGDSILAEFISVVDAVGSMDLLGGRTAEADKVITFQPGLRPMERDASEIQFRADPELEGTNDRIHYEP